jgi:integrase
MAYVHFRAKEIKSKKVQIYLDYTFQKGRRLRYFTGYTENASFWDSKSEKFKGTKPVHSEMNVRLAQLANEAQAIRNEYIASNRPLTNDIFKERLNQFLNKNESSTVQKNTFIEFYKRFIEERKRNRDYASGSIKVYQNTFNKLTSFKPSVDFTDFSFSFFSEFELFLMARGYKKNYIGKITSTLKTVLKDAEKKEVKEGFKYKQGWIKHSEEQVNKIYLKPEELEKIYKLDLNQNLRLLKVRDLFVVACWTGLRFSDFRNLKSEYFKTSGKGNVTLNMITQKTRRQVVIPIKPIVLEILERYSYKMEAISNQKFNQYLKEIGELAEIDSEEVITVMEHGKKDEKKVRKYDLITTHTARRTFATNAYLSGLEVKNIMSMTGHKTEAEFYKYIKVSAEDLAAESANHSFFK